MIIRRLYGQRDGVFGSAVTPYFTSRKLTFDQLPSYDMLDQFLPP
jgi:hypothetical protein